MARNARSLSTDFNRERDCHHDRNETQHPRQHPRGRIIVGALASAPPAGGAVASGPAEQYVAAQLRVVRSLDARRDALADIADQAAARLLAGGQIYLAGESGMCAELAGRAGGLCAAERIRSTRTRRPRQSLGRNDLVLLSDYGTPGKLQAALEKLAPTPALVIVFASAENPAAAKAPGGQSASRRRRYSPGQPHHDASLRSGGSFPPPRRRLPRPSGPSSRNCSAPAADSTGNWPSTSASGWTKGTAATTGRRGSCSSPTLRPAPVPRGQYAHAFLKSVAQSLEAIRGGQLVPNLPGGRLAAGGRGRASQVVRTLQGHLPEVEADAGGEGPYFSQTIPGDERGEKWLRENLHEGDVYLRLGYQSNDDALAAVVNALGARTIFLTSSAPVPSRRRTRGTCTSTRTGR